MDARCVLATPFTLMKFRLVYDGDLKACGNKNRRVDDKWAIRKSLAPQLEQLWEVHPVLKGLGLYLERSPFGREPKIVRSWGRTSADLVPFRIEPGEESKVRIREHGDLAYALQETIDRGNRRFLPLVRKSLDLACTLDILFMRPEQPGEVVTQGGDIDNRLKTLFDALSIPDEQDIRPGDIPIDESTPTEWGEISRAPTLACLLESDSLITGFKVTTDRLLNSPNASPSTVHLVIEVAVSVVRLSERNIGFIGD